MTPEQLDEARAKEAQRLWESGQEAGSSSWVVAARLARENWTPPEPVVDPDVLAFREWAAQEPGNPRWAIEAGWWDDGLAAHIYLAGARMAREQERERTGPLLDYVKERAHYPDGVGGRALNVLAKYRGEA